MNIKNALNDWIEEFEYTLKSREKHEIDFAMNLLSTEFITIVNSRKHHSEIYLDIKNSITYIQEIVLSKKNIKLHKDMFLTDCFLSFLVVQDLKLVEKVRNYIGFPQKTKDKLITFYSENLKQLSNENFPNLELVKPARMRGFLYAIGIPKNVVNDAFSEINK